METLNMSDLNLSNLRDKSTLEEMLTKKSSSNLANSRDSEDDYYCEYYEDIWKTLLEQETEKTTIQLQSPQLEFRGTLVQQLRDVTKKLDLTLATLHCAVAQLDLFMDAHRLRSDRLTHVALACLSLAAKSEEKFSKAPTLNTLSKTSGISLCAKTFRQLEWMVGQHARWRILAPTPVTFALLIAHYVTTDQENTSTKASFLKKFKQQGSKLLDSYLDLTLSDVRLKVLESVDVGCACVACARADLGLSAWPAWLADITNRKPASIVPVARLLQRMMQILKSRKSSTAESDLDQGYGSARTSPNLPIPPRYQVSSIPGTCSSTSRTYQDSAYRPHPMQNMYTIVDINNANTSNGRVTSILRLPNALDMTVQRVDNPSDYDYFRSRRLIEASLETVQPTTSSMAVKRGLESSVDIDAKRYRLTTQMSQVVL